VTWRAHGEAAARLTGARVLPTVSSEGRHAGTHLTSIRSRATLGEARCSIVVALGRTTAPLVAALPAVAGSRPPGQGGTGPTMLDVAWPRASGTGGLGPCRLCRSAEKP